MDNFVNYNATDSLNLPYSLDAEQAVLGCVLMDPTCITIVQHYLRPECFYLPQHEAIYSAMLSIDLVGHKIDALVVLEKLKHDNVYDDAAGKQYLFQLASNIPSVANVEVYAKIVREKYFLRTLINISREIIDTSFGIRNPSDLQPKMVPNAI